jgi:protoporphyrinogen oxidase
MKGNLGEHKRRAKIYSKGTMTGYPFQANTYGLPADTARECVDGFMAAPGRDAGSPEPGNFEDWIGHHFGEGIARHFMLPYNGKLWQYPLSGMTVDGIAPYVPVPGPEDVVRGASPEGAQGLGYNASFFYPDRGGIYSLVEALIPHVRDLSVGQKAMEIDVKKKTVTFGSGYTAWYDSLVSTMPLPELVRIIKDAPKDVAEAAGRLRYVSVYDINLGIGRADVSDCHWIYFPEPEFSFYRVGFLNNFSPAMAPAGNTAMYVEVSHKPDERTGEDELVSGAIDGLVKAGLLRLDDEIPVRDVVDMKHAYVVFDQHRRKALPMIQGYLRENGITSIGRYGAWGYSAMEDAILEGKRAAESVAR